MQIHITSTKRTVGCQKRPKSIKQPYARTDYMYITPKLHAQRQFSIPCKIIYIFTSRIEGLHTNIDDLREARGVAVCNLASELRGRCLHNVRVDAWIWSTCSALWEFNSQGIICHFDVDDLFLHIYFFLFII